MQEFDKKSVTDSAIDLGCETTLSPLKFLESANQIVSLFERGLDRPNEIAGWHGTSVEALERALLLGHLPSSSKGLSEQHAGNLYYFDAKPSDFTSDGRNLLILDGYPGAARYAKFNAAYHFMIKEFGLDFSNHQHNLFVFSLHDEFNPRARSFSEQILEQLHRLGISEATARGVTAAARERQGIVIAISHSAIHSYPSDHGDVVGVDKKLFVPDGLPFSHLSGIEPLGDGPYRYLELLQTMAQALSEPQS
ncbi:MAG: hypothetical protein J0M12_11205 [Deltaproteobacteria bacterium]|nr:hypothetical protein [Deltaproteobacteria bacterium]